MHRITLEEARAAQRTATHALQRLGSVASIGIVRTGTGYALKVNVREAVDIPVRIDGVPVRVEVTGPVHPLSRGRPAA
jgi:hypothetical protein